MTNKEIEQRFELERLASEVIRIQKELNACRGSYHSMREERDKYLSYSMKLESFLTSQMNDWRSYFG